MLCFAALDQKTASNREVLFSERATQIAFNIVFVVLFQRGCDYVHFRIQNPLKSLLWITKKIKRDFKQKRSLGKLFSASNWSTKYSSGQSMQNSAFIQIDV